MRQHPTSNSPAGEPFALLMSEPATWHEGLPYLSDPLAKFTAIIRSPHDPERRSRQKAHAAGSGFEAWRGDLSGEPRDWAAAIVRLLGDGQSRTFNWIVLDLTACAYTADVAGGKPPETGLWLAVERGLLWWANLSDGAVWFSRRARSGGPA